MSKRRVPGIITAAILLVIAVVLLLLHTAPARQFALQQLHARLARHGIDLHASSLDYNLLALTATLRDVVVRSTRAPDLPPFAKADRVYVDLDLLDTIRGYYRIENAEIKNPRLHVVFTRFGTSNLPLTAERTARQSGEAATTGQTEEPLAAQQAQQRTPFHIERFEASGGSFVFEDARQQLTLSLPAWKLEIKGGQARTQHRLRFDTEQAGRAERQQRSVSVERLHLDSVVGADAADLHSLELAIAQSRLSISGSILDFSQPKVDLNASADLQLRPLAEFAGLERPIAGQLNLNAHATGPLAALQAEVTGKGDKLRLQDFRDVSLLFRAAYNSKRQRVRLSTAEISAPFGDIRAQGDLSLATSDSSTLRARILKLNLAQLTRTLDAQLRVASIASGTIDATWPGMEFRRADGKAVFHLRKLRPRPAEKVLPVSGDLVAAARDGRITLSIGSPLPAETAALLRRLQGWLRAPAVAVRSSEAPLGRASPRLPVHDPSVEGERLAASLPRLQPVSFRADTSAHAAYSPRAGGARLNVSPRLLAMLFAFAQQPDQRTEPSMRALEALATMLRGQVSIGPQGDLSGTLRATITDVQALLTRLAEFQGQSQPPIAQPIHGGADVTVRLGGTLKVPRANVQLSAPSLRIGDLRGVAVEMSALYDPAQVTVRSANIRWREQSATLSGTIGLKGRNPALELRARVSGADIRTLLAGMQRESVPASGRISLDARITGTVRNPVAALVLRGADLQAYGESWGALNLQARLENKLLTLQRLELDKSRLPGGALTGVLSYNLRTQAYTLNLEALDFPIAHLTLPNGRVIQGRLAFSARGSGTARNPQLAAQINASGLKVNQQPIGALASSIEVANQRASIRLRAPQWNLTLTASARTTSPYPADFRLDARNLELAKLPFAMAGTNPADQLRGVVTASIRGQGPLGKPQQLDVTAQIAQLKLSFRGQNIRTEGPLVFRFAHQVFQVEPSTIVAGQSTLRIAGRLPLEPQTTPANLRITGRLDLASLMRFANPAAQQAAQVPPEPGVPPETLIARGQLNLDLILRGTLKNIAPEGSLTLRDGFMHGPQLQTPVQALSLDAHIRNGIVQLQQFSARWAGANLRASGQLPLALLPAGLPIAAPKATGPASFNLDLAGLNPGAIQGVPRKVSGRISLHLEARAPALRLEAVEGQLRFDDLQVDAGGIPIAQSGKSFVTVANGLARVERFVITGPQTQLELAGTASLAGARALNLQLRGHTDAGLATALIEGIQIRGATEIQAAVGGTARQPNVQGFVAMRGGQLAMETPPVQASDLNMRLNLTGKRLEIANLTGSLNGGSLRVSGGMGIGAAGLENPDVRISAENIYFNYPDGLRSLESLELHFTSQRDFYLLGGHVHLLEASFRRYVNLETEVLTYIRGGPEVTITEERNRLLSRLHFNVDVDTHSPIVVDNNLARMAALANLRLVGSYYQPSVVGRVNLEEAGELYFSGHTFYIDRGVVTLINERRIEPMLDILTHTQAAGYEISMQVQGRAGDIKTTLTSDPPLPEPDIISVLVFGRPLQEVRGAETNIARQQAFSFITGSLGGAVSNQLQQATGLSMVRIDPTLVADETNPSARLTVGQNLASFLKFVYSMNLTNPGDQIYIGQFDITRRFVSQITKQSDNSYRFDFRHDFRFGGKPLTSTVAKPPERKVASVKFEGNTVFPTKRLEDKFKVHAGDTYDFFKVRKGLDRVESLYRDNRMLEADLRLNSNKLDHTVALRIAVAPGPKVFFTYEGWDVPGSVKHRVEKIWREGVFDAQRIADSVAAIRTALLNRGYLECRVDHSISTIHPGEKRIIFDIQPGYRYQNVKIVFSGAKGISPDKLREVLENGKLKDELLTEPDRVRGLLQRYYNEQGYLTAKVQDPRPEVESSTRTGRIVIPVVEGPQFHVASIRFEGNRAFSADELRNAIPLKAGITYQPGLRDPSIVNIQSRYAKNGYLDANVTYSLDAHPRTAGVDIVFHIEENKQSVVEDIQITGNDAVSRGLISSQILVKPGDILDADKLANSRANLYDTGAFQLVEIDRKPVTASQNGQSGRGPGSAGGNINDLAPYQEPVALQVKVHEVEPFQWRYGAYYDTDRGAGGISDFSSHNLTGNAQTLGLRTRYDRNRQEGRLYFSQPLLRRFPVKSLAETYFTRNVHFTNDNSTVSFIDDHLGFSLSQESKFRKDYLLTWSYRLERVRIFGRAGGPVAPGGETPTGLPPVSGPGGGVDLSPIDNITFPPPPGTVITRRVAPLTGTVTRETRDDVLNATKGLFITHSLAAGFGWLGSQQRYLKYYGQYSQYIPLSKPVQIPFQKQQKSRLVYAGAVRIGLAGGLGGQDLIQSERFFAGGGTTIRGFSQDQVGPQAPGGIPLGGNALFIVNNELRFPLYWIFDGVGFLDVGNVYAKLTDFNPTDIRKAAGLGLRIHTPYILLRADYGIKLDRRTGEKLGQFFISVGQAF